MNSSCGFRSSRTRTFAAKGDWRRCRLHESSPLYHPLQPAFLLAFASISHCISLNGGRRKNAHMWVCSSRISGGGGTFVLGSSGVPAKFGRTKGLGFRVSNQMVWNLYNRLPCMLAEAMLIHVSNSRPCTLTSCFKSHAGYSPSLALARQRDVRNSGAVAWKAKTVPCGSRLLNWNLSSSWGNWQRSSES